MNISVELKNLLRTGDWEDSDCVYWIITNASSTVYNPTPGRYIKVPFHQGKELVKQTEDDKRRNIFVANLDIQKCSCDAFYTYITKSQTFTIPVHEHECFGVPVFGNMVHSYESCWQTPENFFYSEEQAKATLDLLAKTYGEISKEEIIKDRESGEKRYIITPVSGDYPHFNNPRTLV